MNNIETTEHKRKEYCIFQNINIRYFRLFYVRVLQGQQG